MSTVKSVCNVDAPDDTLSLEMFIMLRFFCEELSRIVHETVAVPVELAVKLW